MRIRCLTILLLTFAGFSSALAQTASVTTTTVSLPQRATTNEQQKVGDKINFVQTSQQAIIKRNASSSTHYKLILSGVDHRVLWFADTPNGNAGLWSLDHFIERWNAGSQHLVSDSPNATLVANTKKDDSGNDVVRVFEISHPQYNVKNDTLTYDAKLIFNANHDAEKYPHLYKASLFIDIVCKFGGECF